MRFALVLGGCQGKSGDVTPPPIICQEIDFQSALTSIADGDVFLQKGAVSCSIVNVAVMVNNLSGIWTVGFDLVYPSSAIQYDGYTLGPLLLQGSPANPPVVLVNTTASGLQVTMSRLQPDPSVAASGAED